MRKRIPTQLFFLVLFLVSTSVLSQQTDYFIGKIIDAKTEEPIAFASIRIKDRALGVISNLDGSFKIPFKYKEYGHIIEISSMGYQTKEIPIENFTVYGLNFVRLQPSILELNEAVVVAGKQKKYSARQIVRKAIRAIPDNYPVEPFSTVGYYRDYQLDSMQYVNLNEAILEVFDEGFDAMDSTTTKVKIFNYLQNTDFKRDSLASSSYKYEFEKGRKVIDKAFLASHGGNEFTILRVHDALRNYEVGSYSFVERLKYDLLSQHRFRRGTDTYLDNEPIYTINFGKLLPDYRALGTLYISKINFAIYKMEYTVYDLKKELPDGNRNKHNTTDQPIFEIIKEYRPENDKMYLNYISFHNTFQIWDPPKFVLDSTNIETDLGLFVMKFNQAPNLMEALNQDNYTLKYKGEELNFKRIFLDTTDISRRTVIIVPRMYPHKAREMFATIRAVGRKGPLDPLFFSSEVHNIHDVYGNLVNEWTSRDYDQFREYFVQEVKPKMDAPPDGPFMDKRRPIFQDQPILKPDNFDHYWMNTPLKNAENKGLFRGRIQYTVRLR